MRTASGLIAAAMCVSFLVLLGTWSASGLPRTPADAQPHQPRSVVGASAASVQDTEPGSVSRSGGFPLQFLFAVGELGQPGTQANEVGFAAASDGGYYAVGDDVSYPLTRDVPWVYRYDAHGKLVGSWRSHASDIAVAPDNTVWVTEPSQNRIAHYSAWGAYLGSVSDPATSGTGAAGQPCAPAHVTVAEDGVVYGASQCGLILRFDPVAGTTISAVPNGHAGAVRDLAAAADGKLYGAMYASIAVFDRVGHTIEVWGGVKGEGPGEFKGYCAEPAYRVGCNRSDVGPQSVAIAPDGAIWASDPGNGRIHLYDARGQWRVASKSSVDHFTILVDGTIASRGHQPRSGRAIPHIRSLDVSRDGHVVVAPQNQVVVLGPNGHAVNWFGSPDWDTGSFDRATAVAYDPDGSIYVALDHSVLRYSPAGLRLGGWRLGIDAPETRRFMRVQDLSVARDGTVFVADSNPWRSEMRYTAVHSFRPNGTLIRSWHAADLGLVTLHPIAVDCAADNSRTLILDELSKQVVILTSSGDLASRWYAGASPPDGDGDLFQPLDVAAAHDGSVLVTYHSAIGRVLRQYTADGLLISEHDAQGDRVAVGLDGTVYFSGNGSVGRASLDGSPLPAWRYPPPGHGSFAAPAAVAAGASGSIVVLDDEHQRVQKLGPNGDLLETWGMGLNASTSGTGCMDLADNGDALVTTGWSYPWTDRDYQVLRIDRTGTMVETIGTPIDYADSVYWASAVAVADTGEAVVADTSKRRLVRLDASGKLLHETPLDWLADHEDYEDAAHDIALAADGTALVVGASLGGVARYSPEGERLADWGVDPSMPVRLYGLSSVAASGSGGCYVADTADSEIVELDRSGAFVRRWSPPEGRKVMRIAASSGMVAALTGSEKSPASRVDTFSAEGDPIASWPIPLPGQDIDIDSSGDLVVTMSDSSRHLERLLVYRPDGNSYSDVELPRWWSGTGGSRRISVGATGRIFVAMRGGIYAFDRDGSLASVWRDVSGDEGRLHEPSGVTMVRSLDGSAEIYVSNTGLGRVEVFAEDGQHLKTIGTEGDKPGQFHQPRGLALAEDGSLYVADRRNDRVQRIDSSGNVTGVWDGFLNPIAVAVSPDGTLYVLHDGGVEARSQSGEHLGTLQLIGLTTGQLVVPADIAMSDDTLWVVDIVQRRVLAFGAEPLPVWRASFFRDATWSDGPVYVTTTNQIDYDWGTESPAPGVPADGYAVRFERVLPMDGPYGWDLSVEGYAAFSPGPGRPATVLSGQPTEARVVAQVEGEPVRVHVDFIDTGESASIRLAPGTRPNWTHSVALPVVSLSRHATSMSTEP